MCVSVLQQSLDRRPASVEAWLSLPAKLSSHSTDDEHTQWYEHDDFWYGMRLFIYTMALYRGEKEDSNNNNNMKW